MSSQTTPRTSLDRWIDAYLPGWGVRRAQARIKLSAARQFEATFRGSISSRLSTPWGSSTSFQFGSTADRADLREMRNRARAVDRDNPIGRGLLNTEVDNIVADTFTLQARTLSAEFNKEAEERFARWGDVADLRGERSWSALQRLAYRSARRDGDGGTVLITKGGQSRIQVIPADAIQTPDDGWGKPLLIDGVEMDRAGRAVQYHILDMDEFGKRQFTPVLASDFVYLAHTNEAYQVRGESCYAQIFELLDQIGGYIDGVITASRMATVFGLIFKQSNAAQAYGGLGTMPNSQGVQQKSVTLENGMVKYVGTDDEVAQVQASQPMQQVPDFLRAMLRLIGIPFDFPLELTAKDLSQVNFSSARVGLLQFYRAARSRQQWFEDRWLSRIYRWWISREVKAGGFKSAVPEDFWTHEFMPRGWQFTDPVSEAQAALLEIDAGFNSPQNVAGQLGRDYETLVAQNAAARKLRDQNNIPEVHSTMTRSPTSGNVQQTGEQAPSQTATPLDQKQGDGPPPQSKP